MIANPIDLPDSDLAPGRTRNRAGAACLLSLAAAPTFALMALLTSIHGDGMQDALCSAARSGFALTGMVPMYLLMSAFHLGPWLRLFSSLLSHK